MWYPRLSWSTLKNIEECAQRYPLHRERKRTPLPERWVLVGNVMHYVSEQLIMGVLQVGDIVEAAVRDFERRVREAHTLGWDASEMAEHRQRVITGAWKLAELFDDEFSSVDRGDLRSEMHLFRFYRGWCLEGYMDVVHTEGRDKVLAVYDVKTGSSHTQGQLQFYDVLVEAYFGRRPEKLAWIEPLARGIVPVVVTPEENHEMKKRIKAAVDVITTGEFPATGFPKKCGRCPSEPFCPATQAARNMKIG